MPRAICPSILPAVAVRPDVPEANRRVGEYLESALPGPFAERVILGQVPMAVVIRAEHRVEVGDHRTAKPLVTDRQTETLLHPQVHLATHE